MYTILYWPKLTKGQDFFRKIKFFSYFSLILVKRYYTLYGGEDEIDHK